eukprot:TRINITY_DN5951_c0_g1_i1.p2 TRINITY_DN5951_c0_g1~~TRINITY_DN5951_c0_g1_i1.p2  ORF type:complete len:151 (+),score=5.44 TRINITY_DN5951_c0_g1_i1:653-1105(+)
MPTTRPITGNVYLCGSFPSAAVNKVNEVKKRSITSAVSTIWVLMNSQMSDETEIWYALLQMEITDKIRLIVCIVVTSSEWSTITTSCTTLWGMDSAAVSTKNSTWAFRSRCIAPGCLDSHHREPPTTSRPAAAGGRGKNVSSNQCNNGSA